MPSCRTCASPAAVAGLCVACIAKERAWKAPYVAVLIDVCQALGWDDLAREAQRRFGLYEVGPPMAELERLSYE